MNASWSATRRRIHGSWALLLAVLFPLLLPACGHLGCKCRITAAEVKMDQLQDWNPDLPRAVRAPGRIGTGNADKAFYKDGYVTKKGHKPLLLLHELPGLTPGACDLAVELAERYDYKVYIPLLFGKKLQHSTLKGYIQIWGTRQWLPFGHHDSGPIREDIQALASLIARNHPGQKLTVIGNCLTGALPIELLARNDVQTVVLCQPAVPSSLNRKGREAFGLPDNVVRSAAAVLKSDPEKHVISVNYREDKIAPFARTVSIAEGLKTKDMMGNHWKIIGVARGEGGALSKEPGWIPVEVGNPRDHSTLTGGSASDRQALRRALYKQLSN